jgi:homoserine kinase
VHIHAENTIPVSSGLGSSASAVLTGLLGANSLLDEPFARAEILQLATELEGHPDNVAPALLGGLVISAQQDDAIYTRQLPLAAWDMVVITPDVPWTTQQAREALPAQVPLADAVHNIGRTNFVIAALGAGDLDLLRTMMTDKLHQPYRLAAISGAEASLKSAFDRGAAAVLSGAGPSLIAFCENAQLDEVRAAMLSAFAEVGVAARARRLRPNRQGCLPK